MHPFKITKTNGHTINGFTGREKDQIVTIQGLVDGQTEILTAYQLTQSIKAGTLDVVNAKRSWSADDDLEFIPVDAYYLSEVEKYKKQVEHGNTCESDGFGKAVGEFRHPEYYFTEYNYILDKPIRCEKAYMSSRYYDISADDRKAKAILQCNDMIFESSLCARKAIKSVMPLMCEKMEVKGNDVVTFDTLKEALKALTKYNGLHLPSISAFRYHDYKIGKWAANWAVIYDLKVNCHPADLSQLGMELMSNLIINYREYENSGQCEGIAFEVPLAVQLIQIDIALYNAAGGMKNKDNMQKFRDMCKADIKEKLADLGTLTKLWRKMAAYELLDDIKDEVYEIFSSYVYPINVLYTYIRNELGIHDENLEAFIAKYKCKKYDIHSYLYYIQNGAVEHAA